MGASLRSSSNLPSIHEFSSQNFNSSCFFIHKKRVYSTVLVSTTRPHTVRSGLSRLMERKMHSRGKKIPLFSLLFFSSLRFQAAMPHCRSLLQATPTPTEPTSWSSTLQSKEPTAGSRQLHKKRLQLDASEIKQNKWWSFPDPLHSLWMEHI